MVITAHEDGDIRIFDTNSGKCVYKLDGHIGGVSTIAISADGATLTSGSLI
jgi:WD40 repeat protein